jgi:prepilin-type N-terminal cleavage/methylation domain-containing protein
MNTTPTTHRRGGFTLVEIMVAITIIAILAAIAVPAITNAITQGRHAAIRMEVSSLDDAAQKYQQKYGSFPPDGSNWSVMQRHMRRAFPRMSEPDLTLLQNLTHPGVSFNRGR